MNSRVLNVFLFFSLCSLLFVSCKDDDNVEPTVITAQNFTASIAENSSTGTTIGKIEATTNDNTDVTYSIESQSPNGAVAINATTGELTVSDDSVFDYETNPTITGKIKLQANDVKKSISFTINVTDDTTDNIPTITVQDFTKTIAENSVANGDVLQALGATTTNGTLSYSIVTETPAGAVEVTSAGDVKVKDASLFDYEERQTVTGSIKVSSVEFPQVFQTVSFEIMITNDPNDDSDDSIFNSLSDSRTTYSNASDGDWVEITEAEYKNLFSNLEETTKVGVKDEYYPNESNGFAIGYGTNNRTMVLTSPTKTTKIPANSYVIAFKYYPKIATVTYPPIVKTNEGSDFKTGYSDLGNKLPNHTGDKHTYFTIKGNTTPNINGGYLAAYSGYTGFGYVDSLYDMYYDYGNDNSLDKPEGFSGNIYQGIATTKKQW